MEDNKDMLNSYCRIRKLIGILGFLLPIIIVFFYGNFLPSISHYYYTRSALFFIAILAAFGFFLISYSGYKLKDEEKKKKLTFSDNVVTHIGGFAILIVVLLPTSCTNAFLEICNPCQPNGFCLFGHQSLTINKIHLFSAATFFIAMGYMSLSNFTRGKDTKYHLYYKLCGYIIFISLGLLVIEFIMREFVNDDFNVTGYDVFILETIMVFAFSISWLLKGRTIEYVGDLFISLFSRKSGSEIK